MAQVSLFDITPGNEASKVQFLRRQFSGATPALLRRDIHLGSCTAIVADANSGIGLECSRQLLDLGLTELILAVRDEAKGEAARRTLTATRVLEPGQTIDIWKLDHASYEFVTAFAQRAEHLNPRLDIAILNVDVNRGYHTNCQHVRVLPRTHRRRILRSSDTAAWAKFNEKNRELLLQAFENEANWDKFDRYTTTKFLGQLFVTELFKFVSPSLAIINCANPGLCHCSRLGRELGPAAAVFIRIIGRSAAVGVRTLIMPVGSMWRMAS